MATHGDNGIFERRTHDSHADVQIQARWRIGVLKKMYVSFVFNGLIVQEKVCHLNENQWFEYQ